MNTTNIIQPRLTISSQAMSIFPRPPKDNWVAAALDKGFELIARVTDRYHVALRCQRCCGVHRCRIFTLMSAQPQCPACLEQQWRDEAAAAGLVYLDRHPSDRHYALYQAPCGHQVRRQFELVGRMAAGLTSIRCEVCHAKMEAAKARVRGWSLLGPDPEGNPNYRRYRHDVCGHEQRTARVNMQSGRFSCGGCGQDWPAAPSYLYAMSFTLATGREVVKLGFSRDPEGRLAWQLQRDTEMPCALLRKVAVRTGQMAIRTEKTMHGELKRRYPDAVLAPAHWQGQIRVKSEIYDASLTPVILAMLNEVEAEQQAPVPAD